MKSRFLFIFALTALLLIPVAYANVIFPYYTMVYGANIFLLIPIVLVEAGLAWYLARNWYREQITFLRMSLVFLGGNVFSALIGLLLTGLFYLSIGFLYYNILNKPIGDSLYFLEYPETIFLTSVLLIPALFLSALLEWPIIYLFLRKHMKKAKKVTWKLALFANLLSYFLIFLTIVITQTTMSSFFN